MNICGDTNSDNCPKAKWVCDKLALTLRRWIGETERSLGLAPAY
jgi:hypothetical protein